MNFGCFVSQALFREKGANMLGARLRSWFETQLGRARRRRHKDSSRVRTAAVVNSGVPPLRIPPPPGLSPEAPTHTLHTEIGPKGATLSSPESAYSTGYSTDATLPGVTYTSSIGDAFQQTKAHDPTPQTIRHSAIEASPLSVRLRTKDDSPSRFHTNQKKVEVCGRCGTNSPRRRSRIRTNPWLTPGRTSFDMEPLRLNGRPSCGSDGDDCGDNYCESRERRQTASPSDGDTGLDGGDEGEPDDSDSDSDSERCIRIAPPLPRRRRRRPPRRAHASRSAGTTPLCSRRVASRVQAQQRARQKTPSPPVGAPLQQIPQTPPLLFSPKVSIPHALLAADREAERKYRELIREAERILHDMKGERPHAHNPRVEQLKSIPLAPENRCYSPKKNHITNFMQNNSTEIIRRESPIHSKPVSKQPRSPSAERNFTPPIPLHDSEMGTGWPLSEPMRRKTYVGESNNQFDKSCQQSLLSDDRSNIIYSPPYPRKAPEGQIRRQMLVRTIESLKRSLEEQSDGLQRVHQENAPY